MSLRAVLASTVIAGVATLVPAQTNPTAAPTNPVPTSALTPGTGISTTPGAATGLYAIPNTTPVGMPAYSTPGPGPTAVSGTGRPAVLADCAGDHWRGYPALAFKSRANCQAWVRRHAVSASGTPAAASRATTPRARRTPPTEPTPVPR